MFTILALLFVNILQFVLEILFISHENNKPLCSSVMEGEESLRRYSPEVVVQDPYVRHAASLLPPIILFHGTSDYSIPCDARLFSLQYTDSFFFLSLSKFLL